MGLIFLSGLCLHILSKVSLGGFFISFFFCHPMSYLRPFFFISLLVVTRVRGHKAGSFSLLSPLRFVPRHFFSRGNFSPLPRRRLASNWYGTPSMRRLRKNRDCPYRAFAQTSTIRQKCALVRPRRPAS